MVAGELDGATQRVGHLAVGARVDVAALLRPGVRLRAVALLGHQPAEAVLVDREALLGGHLEGEVDGEAVGVVQRERLGTRELRPAGLLHLGGREVEDRGAGPQRLAERLLLRVGDGRDPLPVAVQVGVGLPHLVPADRQQLGQRAVLVAEQAHRADRAAQQPAQDVAARLVAGGDPVPDQHHRAADVVGHDPEPDVVLVVGAVPAPGQLHRLLDDGEHDVDLVHVRLVLEQEGDAFEAHAGVDVLLRQRAADVEVLLAADRAELLLHEDEVPDLEVAVLERGRHLQPGRRLELAVGPVRRAPVVEDLGAGPTGTGHAHRPVVLLLAELDDAVLGQPGDLHPEGQRLGVVDVHARPEPALLEPPAALVPGRGDELPGVLDGTLLEVVTEGEVAAHLEERAVPRGLADVLDVRGPHALLDADGAVVRRRLLAQEVGLERHHARVHEEQVRVVEEQGGRGHRPVAVALEVSDEPAPDLRGLHQWVPSSSVLAVGLSVGLRGAGWGWACRGRPRHDAGHPRARASHEARARSARATRFPCRPDPARPRRGRAGRRPRDR